MTIKKHIRLVHPSRREAHLVGDRIGVHHNMDLFGIGPLFEEFSTLHAQRRNILPRESSGGRLPLGILIPTKTPLHLFQHFGCHATIHKPEICSKKCNRGG